MRWGQTAVPCALAGVPEGRPLLGSEWTGGPSVQQREDEIADCFSFPRNRVTRWEGEL